MSYPHWHYFLSIEEDLLRCSRYVEFDEQNYKTYSVEFARIIVASGAEFDAVAKVLCKLIAPEKEPGSINAYYPTIISRYPRFVSNIIEVPRFKITVEPWKGWTQGGSPEWWSKGYAMIKHHRHAHFPAANLWNAIQATAGLLVGILYLYDIQYGSSWNVDFVSRPRLFEPQEDPLGLKGAQICWRADVLK